MTKLRKTLALLLCMTLCLSIVPAAFAEGNSAAGAQLGDSNLEVFYTAKDVKATVNGIGCRDVEEINEALLNGGTIVLVADDLDGQINILNSVTLDLNGHTYNGDTEISGSLTIVDTGDGGKVKNMPVLDGGVLKVYGGTYTNSGVSKYVASGYMLKQVEEGWKVLQRDTTAESAIAVVNGTEFYTTADINEYLDGSSATVKLHKKFEADIVFRNGGTLDLNGNTVADNVVNYGETLRIQDSGFNGEVIGKVSNPTGGTVTITGGKFGTKPNDSFIANGYGWDADKKQVLPIDRLNKARIGSTYYPELNDAVEAARSGAVIVALERTDIREDYKVLDPIQKTLTFQLGSNGIEALVVDSAEVDITDGFIGELTVRNGAEVNVSGTRFTAMPTVDGVSVLLSDVELSPVGINRHLKNSTDDLSFNCGQALAAEKAIYIDTNALAANDFVIDGTGITLLADCLNALEVGVHSLRLLTGRDEYASASFEILAEIEPVEIKNTPYVKGSGEDKEIWAVTVKPADYSIFAYSAKDDDAGREEIDKDNYYFRGNELVLRYSWLDSLAWGTYSLYGFHAAMGQYIYFGDFTIENGEPPVITQQPSSQTKGDGERVTFTVRAEGEALKYQWRYRKGDSGEFVDIEGATGASYSFTATLENNGWQYCCVVDNGAETKTVSEIAMLTVELSAPVIVTQPTSQTVTAGEQATFHVVATGGELSYRWFSRDSNRGAWNLIPGETTDTLVVTASKEVSGYEFTCEVSNTQGTAYSTNVRLTVVRPAELDKPESLTAEENVEGAVVLSWDDVDYAEMYRAYRQIIGTDEWVTLGDTSEPSFTDSTAEAGKTYIYAVRCVKTDGGAYDSELSDPSAPVTVYGSTCVVSFETNGGTRVNAQTVVKHQKAVKPAVPSKSGYWFVRWYTDSAFTKAFSFDTPIVKDTVLYARWIKPDFVTPIYLTEIGEEAFAGDALTAVRLYENVETIGNRAFANCPKLCIIYIPAATKNIADDAFDGLAVLTILGKAGSEAEAFALAHNYDFQAVL